MPEIPLPSPADESEAELRLELRCRALEREKALAVEFSHRYRTRVEELESYVASLQAAISGQEALIADRDRYILKLEKTVEEVSGHLRQMAVMPLRRLVRERLMGRLKARLGLWYEP